jgi:hypothetical protein
MERQGTRSGRPDAEEDRAVTATRYPTREAVLACVDGEWQTTRDVFDILDTWLVMRAGEKRQVSDVKCEWRRA